jgi:uncharacterized protein involved in outer membrane biogenesis
VSQLDTKVTIEKGKPSVKVGKLQLSSSAGGTGGISGSFSLPLDLKEIEFRTSVESFKVFDATVNLKAAKPKESKLTFDLDLVSPSLGVLAKGLVFAPAHKKTDFIARLENFRLSRAVSSESKPPSKTEETKPKDFDLTPITGRTISAEALIKNLQFGTLPELQDVTFLLRCQDNKAFVEGGIRLCDTNFRLNAVLIPPSGVTAQIEGKGVSLDLTSFIACFSKELPVFLAGKLSISARLSTTGVNPKALLDAAEGEVMVSLAKCSVYRLSNLDYRLAFILDMLSVAGLNPASLDSIDFSKAIARASLQNGRVILDKFSLTGPVVDAWGKGEFSLKEKRLRLSGQVRTALGITKDLDIDRVLDRRQI